MKALLVDSGPLIASYNPGDPEHEQCTRFFAGWSGKMIILEPVLGETCNFLRNHARKGPWLEARLLHAITGAEGDFTIENPLDEDRARAAQLTAKLVDAPFGYVDSMVLAMAERMHVPDIATVDYKMLGMAGPVSRLKPLNWVLQNYGG